MTEATDFKAASTSTAKLVTRRDTNTQYGQNDFQGWVGSLIDRLDFRRALDVCCGTGDQLVVLGRRTGLELLAGVDAASNSIAIAEDRLRQLKLSAQIVLRNCRMEEMFETAPIADLQFDVISCFYGLYYSLDARRTLEELVDHVPVGGTVLIVGPFGRNNSTLFELLGRHYPLPELAIRSATTFMPCEVIPVLARRCSVTTEDFVNNIVYPDVTSLLKYWRASTFYSREHDAAVGHELEARFKERGEFAMEKHVMACFAKKVR